jgi:uncharacterized membrane protein
VKARAFLLPVFWLDRLQGDISKNPLCRAFALLVIPLGIFLTFITPAGQVPDETAHIVRGYALAHGEFAGTRQISTTPDGRLVANAGAVVDPAIVWTSYGTVRPVTAADFASKTTVPWTGSTMFVDINPVAVYFPIFYVPSAIGIRLAQMIGARPHEAFLAARLVSFMVFAFLGLLALVIAKNGQTVIFVALSLPMTMSLGSSCNPDGLLIATTALAIALITRGWLKSAAACLAAVILVKPPYALLALALLYPLPLPSLWMAEHLKLAKRIALVTLAILPGALWFIYTMAAIAAPTAHPAYHPGPLWPGDPGTIFYATDPSAQLECIIAHPLGSLKLVWTSIMTNPWLVRETIGLLGYQSVLLTPDLYQIWMVGIAGAVVADLLAEEQPRSAWPDILLLMLVIIVSVYLVWISQYLNWTRVGLNDIDGPAGRYLLPLIPIFGLALPKIGFFRGAWVMRRVAMSLPILAAFYTLLLLPRWLVVQFYLN